MSVVARRHGFDSRADIGLVAPRSINRNVNPSRGGAAMHYIGARLVPRSHADCRASWRASQRHHMAPGGLGATHGASDIGYSTGVCPHGIVMAGRGWGVRPAAQGSNDGNYRFLAVQGLIGPGQTPTVEMLEGIAWVVWEWRRLGAGMEVRPHQYFRSTSCPGPLLSLASQLHQRAIPLPSSGQQPPQSQPSPPSSADWRKDLVIRMDLVNLSKVTGSSSTWVRSPGVRRLQGLLLAAGYGPTSAAARGRYIDGIGGPATRRDLDAVQRKHRTGRPSNPSQADSIAGRGTWAALAGVKL